MRRALVLFPLYAVVPQAVENIHRKSNHSPEHFLGSQDKLYSTIWEELKSLPWPSNFICQWTDCEETLIWHRYRAEKTVAVNHRWNCRPDTNFLQITGKIFLDISRKRSRHILIKRSILPKKEQATGSQDSQLPFSSMPMSESWCNKGWISLYF